MQAIKVLQGLFIAVMVTFLLVMLVPLAAEFKRMDQLQTERAAIMHDLAVLECSGQRLTRSFALHDSETFDEAQTICQAEQAYKESGAYMAKGLWHMFTADLMYLFN